MQKYSYSPNTIVITTFMKSLFVSQDYPALTEMTAGSSLLLGAGAGPWPYLNRNCEMMPNLVVKAGGTVQVRKHIKVKKLPLLKSQYQVLSC